MTATTVEHHRPRPRAGGPHRTRPDPVHPAAQGRAGQDVRHPGRLLADGEHRRDRGDRHRRPSSCSRPTAQITYDNFGAAIGVPMTLLLPVMAILSVTSEYTQRSGLTTFTLVPHRGRVIRAKAVVAMALGAVSIGVALAIGALGNILGSTIAGVDTVWDISGQQIALPGLRQRAQPADRLHARRADPQLPRRDRRASSSTRSCSRPSPSCWATSSSGGRTSAPGWTSTGPRASCTTAA